MKSNAGARFKTLFRSVPLVFLLLAPGCNATRKLVCPSVGAQGLKPDIVAHVNQLRSVPRNCGDQSFPAAPPVVWSDILAQAAMRHSVDMAEHEFLEHTGSDGSTAATRLADAGYPFSTFGENILSAANSSPEAANNWIASPGHCANIMDPNFTEIGVAAAKGKQGDCEILYWTMDLARPLGS